MMTRTLAIVLGLSLSASAATAASRPVWPAAPDTARIEFLGEIKCDDLVIRSGLFGRIKRLIGGSASNEELALPFDVLVRERALYMTCQNLPALVEVNLDDMSYRLHSDNDHPFAYPIALCGGGDAVYVTDSENAAVYRLRDGKIAPLITKGLIRPTGIATIESRRRLYVVDTGDHTVKIFDYDGNPVRTIGGHAGPEEGLNFPTFAAGMGSDAILVNDALNYRIKRFDGDGEFISAFGDEGDGPGSFSRPKGVAVDSDEHVYVVDNLFDNIQVFDAEGRILLVVGTGGREAGQFWSPGGIDIANDTIYVADTFNNRVQILRYLGGGR